TIPGDRALVGKRSRRLTWRQLLIALAGVLAFAAIAGYGHYYWTVGRFLVSTDDATVQADSVIISPKVSGYISAVLVDDNQPVHVGQVLARIDDRDYSTAVAAAQANVQSAQAAVRNTQQQEQAQRLAVVQARETVTADKAALAFSQQQNVRY